MRTPLNRQFRVRGHRPRQGRSIAKSLGGERLAGTRQCAISPVELRPGCDLARGPSSRGRSSGMRSRLAGAIWPSGPPRGANSRTNEKPANVLAGWLRTGRAVWVDAGGIATSHGTGPLPHGSADVAAAHPDHPDSRRKKALACIAEIPMANSEALAGDGHRVEVVRIRAGTSCRHCEYRAGVPGFKRRGLGSRRSLANVRPKALAGNVFAVQQEFAGSARMRPVSSQCEPCTRRPAPRARGDAASALKLCRSVLRSFPSSVRPPAACQAAISLDAASSPILLNSLVAVCLPGTRLPVLYRSPPACRRTAS